MKPGTSTIFTVEIPELVFPGFYNTDFDPDNVLDECTGEEDDYINQVEYYQDSVINNILDHYRKVMPDGFRIRNYKLKSPKEYNYRNDKLELQISCTYEDILFYFFNYDREDLAYYLELDKYYDYQYPEALLEVLLEFWPFDDPDEEWDDMSLKEKFIYG